MNLESYLKLEPKARERTNKNRAIGNLIQENYSLEIDRGKMADIVGEILSMDRKWRDILFHDKSLRGSDYDDKKVLSQKYQIEQLNYEPMHHQFIKQAKLL